MHIYVCMKPGCLFPRTLWAYTFVSDDYESTQVVYCATCAGKAIKDRALTATEVSTLEILRGK